MIEAVYKNNNNDDRIHLGYMTQPVMLLGNSVLLCLTEMSDWSDVHIKSEIYCMRLIFDKQIYLNYLSHNLHESFQELLHIVVEFSRLHGPLFNPELGSVEF